MDDYSTDVFERRIKGKKTVADLPDIFYGFIEKVTNKRIDNAQDDIEAIMQNESDKLFTLIANRSIDVLSDPFPFYDEVVWHRLSQKWIKKKGHDRFWFYTGALQDWFYNTLPSGVFGKPELKIAKNKKAKGYQYATFSYRPYPNLRSPEISSSSIKRKLFGKNRKGVANEEVRPIIKPAVRALISGRLKSLMLDLVRRAIKGEPLQ